MDGAFDWWRSHWGEVRVFATARSRHRFIVHVILAVMGLVTISLIIHPHLAFLTDANELRTLIQQFGVWAPLALVLLQALQVVLAPVPGHILAVISGYLFGPWWGTVYNMIGITLGSSLAFWLSRTFGRSYVERVVHPETLATVDAFSEDFARPTIFVFFLVPGLPDDVLCFLGGLTNIPIWQLVAIAIVGRAPAFFLVNVFGGFLGTGQYPAAIAVVAVFIAISVLGYRNRDRLVRLFERES